MGSVLVGEASCRGMKGSFEVTRVLIAAGVLVMGMTPALAVLPPQYERQEQLGLIVNSMEIVNAIDVIDSIEAIDWDTFKVTGGRCHVIVRTVDIPLKPGEEMVAGPRNFTLEVGEMVCD